VQGSASGPTITRSPRVRSALPKWVARYLPFTTGAFGSRAAVPVNPSAGGHERAIARSECRPDTCRSARLRQVRARHIDRYEICTQRCLKSFSINGWMLHIDDGAAALGRQRMSIGGTRAGIFPPSVSCQRPKERSWRGCDPSTTPRPRERMRRATGAVPPALTEPVARKERP